VGLGTLAGAQTRLEFSPELCLRVRAQTRFGRDAVLCIRARFNPADAQQRVPTSEFSHSTGDGFFVTTPTPKPLACVPPKGKLIPLVLRSRIASSLTAFGNSP
jgi:hypothetical protein